MNMYTLSAKHRPQNLFLASRENGFTLIELLVSSVILVVAVTGSIVAFNLVTSSVRGTGLRANQSRIIDRDIALINELSEVYGTCATPAGSSDPSGCTDSEPGESFYYFPADPTNITAFEAACEDGSIVDNFIASVNGTATGADVNIPTTTGVVTRQNAVRVAGTNHLVRITWNDADGDQLRQVEVLPIVTAWCP